MPESLPRLIYVADPMCSWCWGFAKEFQQLQNRDLGGRTLPVQWIMGGLAPDDDSPMPDQMRSYIQSAWDQVEKTTGAEFNRRFWEECEPRRSTYLSCRAVIAAESMHAGASPQMFAAIQRAYYLEAKNPSELETLVGCAETLELDGALFAARIAAPETQVALEAHLDTCRELQAQGFPSLYVVPKEQVPVLVMRGYSTADEVWSRIEAAAG